MTAVLQGPPPIAACCADPARRLPILTADSRGKPEVRVELCGGCGKRHVIVNVRKAIALGKFRPGPRP